MVMGMDSEAGRQLGNRRVPRSALSAILALKAAVVAGSSIRVMDRRQAGRDFCGAHALRWMQFAQAALGAR